MSDHVCPSCARAMSRAERNSFFEKYVYPWFGLYPWRCRHCRHRESLRDRGERRRRSSTREERAGKSERRRSTENAS